MKKFIAIIASGCFSLFISSYRTAPNHSLKMQKAAPVTVTWPITGTTGSSVGTVNYVVQGSGTAASSITFTQGTTSYGTYYFSPNGNGAYAATGMKATLNITSVIVGVFTNTEGYTIDFISPY